jgi:hypothetical protein
MVTLIGHHSHRRPPPTFAPAANTTRAKPKERGAAALSITLPPSSVAINTVWGNPHMSEPLPTGEEDNRRIRILAVVRAAGPEGITKRQMQGELNIPMGAIVAAIAFHKASGHLAVRFTQGKRNREALYYWRDIPESFRTPVESGAKERACMMCQKKFLSTFSGHRICLPCKNSRDWKTGTATVSTILHFRSR